MARLIDLTGATVKFKQTLDFSKVIEYCHPDANVVFLLNASYKGNTSTGEKTMFGKSLELSIYHEMGWSGLDEDGNNFDDNYVYSQEWFFNDYGSKINVVTFIDGDDIKNPLLLEFVQANVEAIEGGTWEEELEPTTTDYLQELINQRNQLARNLVAKGVEASEDEKFNTLVRKVLDI